MGHGIVSYAGYLPRHRLLHEELGSALGTRGGKGGRVLASYDEDATTMAVEAARRLIDGDSAAGGIGSLYFATTTPPYVDKTNATAIHAALDLGHGASRSTSPARPAPRRVPCAPRLRAAEWR